ncbi:hypothetical protein HanRHA438_Chr12g0545531 [Helianthus annuus]|nr:hypothetical protein HanRHA438_Chr12g0545531 [Helianthus annuus]
MDQNKEFILPLFHFLSFSRKIYIKQWQFRHNTQQLYRSIFFIIASRTHSFSPFSSYHCSLIAAYI